jgi:hypothetical protein
MMKSRYLTTINWQGEVHSFYSQSSSAPQALRSAIDRLATKTGYDNSYVRKYVMEANARRWETVVK